MREENGDSSFGRLGALLVFQLVAGYALACLCFLLGFPLGGWQYVLPVGATVAAAFCLSKQTGWSLLVLEVLVFVLTLFTFTYIHCDASSCHVPMARFLEEGWNPVRETSIDRIYGFYAAHGITAAEDNRLAFHALHVLIDPKFTQILAAQMQAACGLFTAAAYPLWTLFFALALMAWRTAREIFAAPRWAAGLLAAFLCCNFELTYGSLRGQVDFVTYAAVVLAGLSLLNWNRHRRTADLLLFFAALVIASVSKFTGLCTAVLYLILASVLGWRERAMRRGALLFLASFALFGLLPYWTAAWWYGSPLYPAHTFRADVVLPDLTSDFLDCNAAARQMGYLARMVLAYVSRDLALWGCRLWSGDPGFTPVWGYEWLTCGYEGFRCVLLWSGLVVCFLRRRRDVCAVTAVLFLSFLLIPTKYIGFPRYVAQVHAAVGLAWFAFACHSAGRTRTVILAGFSLLALGAASVSVTHFCQQLRIEAVVQRNVERMKASGLSYAVDTLDKTDDMKQETWSYIVTDRLVAQGGADVGINRSGERLLIDWHMILRGRGLDDTFDRWPRPLWR